MQFIRGILLILFFMVALLFFKQNITLLDQASVYSFGITDDLNWKTPPVPLYIATFGFFLLGAVGTWLMGLFGQMRVKKELSVTKKQVRQLQEELEYQVRTTDRRSPAPQQRPAQRPPQQRPAAQRPAQRGGDAELSVPRNYNED